MTRVLITGVRGKTGAPLAVALASRPDVEVLGGSTDPARVMDLRGVAPTRFSWDDDAGWSSATRDVDALFLVRPDRPDAPELIAELLATAPAGMRVVLLSEADADRFAPDHWALRVERAVRDAGRPWTVLRPGWFMQVFTDPRFYAGDLRAGRLPFAGGGAEVAWIDTRDIAAVAERALLDAAHDGQVYEISGPEAMTLPRTASVLTEVLGHPVEHVELTVAQAAAELPPGFDRDELVWTLERLANGGYARVTDVVERVTGRAARRLADLDA